MSDIEVAVCPRCARPFPAGADYCTQRGGQLGIAETTLPYIPVPNSARFADRIEPAPRPPSRPRPFFRAVGVMILAAVPLSWALLGAYPDDPDAGPALVAVSSAFVGVLAWLYFTFSARRARSGAEK